MIGTNRKRGPRKGDREWKTSWEFQVFGNLSSTFRGRRVQLRLVELDPERSGAEHFHPTKFQPNLPSTTVRAPESACCIRFIPPQLLTAYQFPGPQQLCTTAMRGADPRAAKPPRPRVQSDLHRRGHAGVQGGETSLQFERLLRCSEAVAAPWTGRSGSFRELLLSSEFQSVRRAGQISQTRPQSRQRLHSYVALQQLVCATKRGGAGSCYRHMCTR